ncbi:NUDIX hydrolase [Vibrio metschnikovii]|uniref:8-oxo-dGTP diphosphatase n=1 Tax=Vibrio metschnikovii TaxID=28172 RepID=A0A9X0R912_VIBME|nr:NUDIX domain-containing protein [Vibrio metschnikovii]MBC5850320.1 NUDIX domain-containing protein [Vibrio metschnikovii]
MKLEQALPIAECVSFLLIKDGQCLLERRSAHKISDPNTVAIPGGHLDSGESQLMALQREVDEELGVKVMGSVYLCSLYHPTECELQLLHYYIVEQWQGEIACYEAEEVFWTIPKPDAVETTADKIAIQEYHRLYKTGLLSN